MAKKSYRKYKSKSKKGKSTQADSSGKSADDILDTVKNSKKCFKAKQYLDNFANDKETWKFNKMLQVFILNYILVKEIFSKDYFDIFKNYFKDMNEKTKTVRFNKF